MLSRLASLTLRALDPETAHESAIRLLPYWPLPKPKADPGLAISIAGLNFPHPICLAAGFDKHAQAYTALHRVGFAAVEVGTVTPLPQDGNRRPRLFRLTPDKAIINRYGFNSDGLWVVCDRLARRDPNTGVLGVNIGVNKDEHYPVEAFADSYAKVYLLCDYVTVNVSSPNTPGLRALQRPSALIEIIDKLNGVRNRWADHDHPRKPFFIKVAPDLNDDQINEIAKTVVNRGVDGLIVSNTTVRRPGPLVSRHANESGGLSGQPLFTASTQVLAKFYLHLRDHMPLIASGGVSTADQAYRKIKAGASLVQVYTALTYQGPALVPRMLRGLSCLVAKDGHACLADTIGLEAGLWT